MFRFRRLVGVALEDFGLRRTADVTTPPPPAPPPPLPTPTPTPTPKKSSLTTEVHSLPFPPEAAAHVVFHGSAPRRPELHRFCEHLELVRTGDHAPSVLQA